MQPHMRIIRVSKKLVREKARSGHSFQPSGTNLLLRTWNLSWLKAGTIVLVHGLFVLPDKIGITADQVNHWYRECSPSFTGNPSQGYMLPETTDRWVL